MGGFDNVAVVDAPDDESLAKYVLTLGSEGNLRTVLRLFPRKPTGRSSARWLRPSEPLRRLPRGPWFMLASMEKKGAWPIGAMLPPNPRFFPLVFAQFRW